MWRVVFSFRVRDDVAEAAIWYEGKQAGLGRAFVDEVVQVWRELANNPPLAARKHPTKNLRWRYPLRFPYRIIYEVDESGGTVLVLAVVHASRNDAAWRG
ncbi:MAG: toxin ParE1/3/4 [Verrucomicrobiota bacterium]|nr:toxin ParE1/3/4 [Verrucomicrobiota bacterium]